ncbi:hypothetical protein HDA32_002410 [Spinactinospora alkalitolerans]|uniref:Uncharacterized protein n=1 Tax=Spinactinospora alkalitolerans TaxID=687207 RepID=A0A852TZT7_9ACTN|nr:hypothetical protein [Spinactinospora alkalitolerans]NYE47290.1 hypothetical protein [Spinactinospora alkalitolerans]
MPGQDAEEGPDPLRDQVEADRMRRAMDRVFGQAHHWPDHHT